MKNIFSIIGEWFDESYQTEKKEEMEKKEFNYYRDIYTSCITESDPDKVKVYNDIIYQIPISNYIYKPLKPSSFIQEYLTVNEFRLVTKDKRKIEKFITNNTQIKNYDVIGLDFGSFKYDEYTINDDNYYRVSFKFGGLRLCRNIKDWNKKRLVEFEKMLDQFKDISYEDKLLKINKK